jgi:uncharacterized LabA/DUF88 family protein
LFDALTAQARATARLRTYWYVVEHIDFIPWGLHKLLTEPEKLERVVSRDESIATELGRIAEPRERLVRVRQIAEELIAQERRMKSRFDGWGAFQDGIMRRFDAIEFRRAGSIQYNLFDQTLGKEKAVDVKLATDLLELRGIYDIGVIVSGDQDYVPAVQAAKDSGKQIVNVSFLKRDGMVLPGGARRLNQATDRTVEMSYAELKAFLHFPPGAEASTG